MQLSDMRSRVSQRLNEGGGAVFYPSAEIDASINEAQRFFCLLTLALEITANWSVSAATPFTHMLTVFSDWICPLRITLASGAKVRPATLAELSSLDPSWIASAGAPERYCELGADLVGIYKQPAGGGTTLSVTYARAPVVLSADGDVPEIPGEYHPRLIEYGEYRCRQVEGAGEFQKALPLLNAFLDGAQTYGTYMRQRNIGNGYDKVPFELEKFDRSKLLGKGA